MKRHAVLGMAMVAGLAACDTDLTVPDYANPDLRNLIESPTPDLVRQAAVGLLHSTRADHDTYVRWGGILGREGYYLDPNEARYVRNIYAGNPLGTNFTGNAYWVSPYRSIQLGYLLQNALDRVEMPAAEESAIRGFAGTIQGLDYIQLLNTRQNIPVEVDNPLDGITTPPPIADRAAAFAFISTHLDAAFTALNGLPEDMVLPFPSTSGLRRFGFDRVGKIRQLNRALKARLEVLRAGLANNAATTEYEFTAANYTAALTALNGSFLTLNAADFPVGPYQTYSGNSGDFPNTLYDPSGKTVADSMLWTRAAPRGAGKDLRIETKTAITTGVIAVQGLSSNRVFTMYPNQAASIPMIRNEELILLRAEARWFTGDHAGAMADLNFVRTNSGGLDPIAEPASDAEFITALLYERRYSLLFEGAHSWVDWRRFGRLTNTCGSGPVTDTCRGLHAMGSQRTTGTNSVATWLPLPSNETLPRS